MLLDLFVVICGLVMGLFIFFESDAIPDWFRLLRINKLCPFLQIDVYFKALKDSPMNSATNYIEFISSKYWDYWIVRALFCPVCLTPVLLSIILSLVFLNWYLFPVVYIGYLFGFLSLKRLYHG